MSITQEIEKEYIENKIKGLILDRINICVKENFLSRGDANKIIFQEELIPIIKDSQNGKS